MAITNGQRTNLNITLIINPIQSWTGRSKNTFATNKGFILMKLGKYYNCIKTKLWTVQNEAPSKQGFGDQFFCKHPQLYRRKGF